MIGSTILIALIIMALQFVLGISFVVGGMVKKDASQLDLGKKLLVAVLVSTCLFLLLRYL